MGKERAKYALIIAETQVIAIKKYGSKEMQNLAETHFKYARDTFELDSSDFWFTLGNVDGYYNLMKVQRKAKEIEGESNA